ncbi:TetR/AcrR family transcriptional regulator OS=Streptomyces rimosus subsp. rimosus (strain ATCC/ DSM 40260 / JCM 4667 / NRRL 2234) OX=1265868 GN=SRIM_022105 PE=4 SV=1 [Streptomyces rimosus subsp. rimosus]
MQDRPEFAETMELSVKAMYARKGLTAEQMLEHDFAFALDLQIAGIEAMRERERVQTEGVDTERAQTEGAQTEEDQDGAR